MSFLLKPVLPKEHGAWVALLVPMFIGSAAYPDESFNLPGLLLLALCAGFGMLFIEPVRIVLKQTAINDSVRMYGWMAIYFTLSAGSFILLIYTYERWGLLWFVIPAGLMVALKLWASVAKMERVKWIGIAGVLGLTISAPAAFYTQHGSFLLESLVLYLLCAIWVIDRANSARIILLNIRSGTSPSNENSLKIVFSRFQEHLFWLFAVIILLVSFHEHAPSMAFLPFLLATYKNVESIIFGKIPVNPFKFGFSEMRLSILFGLFMVFVWRIDHLL